jgi:tight adherence protein B
MTTWSIALLRTLGILLSAAGLAAVFYVLVLSERGPVRANLARYAAYLDRHLQFLRSPYRGAQIIVWQAVAVGVVLAAAVGLAPVLVILAPLVALFPAFQLKQQRDRRTTRIEEQLDSWMMVLSNALRAVPSIGDALASSQALTYAPIAEELDVVLKEYQLGTPLDQAIQNMGDRVNSRVVSTALTTLQVARRTGGDLPATLETSAASLREMARLEGVVRTKTADGRNQAWVIGAMPLALIVMLHMADPKMLTPLIERPLGNVLALAAFLLWAGAIALSMRILQVDI